MQQSYIFQPMFVMILLTLFIALRMLMLRYRAVLKDGLRARYFLLNQGYELPDYLVKVTQHYENLFETPILFYFAIFAVFVLNQVDVGYLALAWLYVVFRVIHAYVHITYNNLKHRRWVFLCSMIVLYTMWGRIMLQVIFQ